MFIHHIPLPLCVYGVVIATLNSTAKWSVKAAVIVSIFAFVVVSLLKHIFYLVGPHQWLCSEYISVCLLMRLRHRLDQGPG